MNIKSEREKKEFRKDVQAIFQNPFEEPLIPSER